MDLISFRLFETGTYQPMERRTFVTNVNGDHIAQLNELTRGGQNLSASAVAPVAAQIMTPSSQAIAPAIIAGGWDNARCRFVAEFKSNGFNGAGIRKIVTGYTDHLGINPGTNSINEDMRFYINNIIDLVDSVYPTAHGTAIQTTVRGCDQLIFGNYDMNGRTPNDLMIRPGDIMNSAGSQSEILRYAGEGDFADLRMTFVNGGVRSRRSNLNPTQYLTRTLRSAAQARLFDEDNGSDTLQYVSDTATAMVQDAPMSGDQVIRELNQKYDFNKRGFVTWRELRMRWPQLMAPGFLKVNLFGGAHARRALHRAGQTEHWRGDSVETMIATLLGNALPGILSENGIYRIGLLLQNGGFGNQNEVIVTAPPQGLNQSDIPIDVIERMKVSIANDLMPGVTQGGYRIVSINIQADILSEISLSIRVGTNPAIDYCVPSFSDNTFTLVTTNSMEHAYSIVADVSNLMNNMGHSPSAFEPASRIFTGAGGQMPSYPDTTPRATTPGRGASRWNL